jgi:lysophospholipase L1-like esterase
MIKKILISLVLLLLTTALVHAQAFANEIAAFKTADSIHYPFEGKHPIVFAGSSSFRLWKNMEKDFEGYPVLNRGFGGSTLPDVIQYAEEVIIKYSPKQVIIYCGENDFAAADTMKVTTVVNNFRLLFTMIRKKLPAVPIAYVSMKPSPSRTHLLPKFQQANKQIKKFLKYQPNTVYIDVYSLMLNNDGGIQKDIFIEDNLHMNEKGYRIWTEAIKPFLLK